MTMSKKPLYLVMIRTQLRPVWHARLSTKQMPSYALHVQTSCNQRKCRTAGNVKVSFVEKEYTPTLATMAAASFVELRNQLQIVEDYRITSGDDRNMLLSWEGIAHMAGRNDTPFASVMVFRH